MLQTIIKNCVQRRMLVLVMTAVVIALGIKSYISTPIEAYPDVTNTQVQVITQMPGYAAKEIERQITIPLERALNGTQGMKLMRSESLFGLSLVTLIFNDDAKPITSRMLVNQRLSQADLPDGITPSLAPEATPLGKIYRFRLTSDRHNLYELRSEMQWNVTRVLRKVQGVADVVSWGGYFKEIHIEADPAKLLTAGLTLNELSEAISKANLNVGGGFLRNGDQELTIRGIGYITSVEDLKKIPLKSKNSSALTLEDVASVKLAAAPRRGSVGWNENKEIVEGLVLMRIGENPSLVLDGIHQQVEALNATILPKGMKIEVFQDRSVLVNHSLSTVHENLLHGFLLVVGVVWLFLRSLKGSLIVAVIIPLSLLVAFLGLYAMGLPANLISMGAIDFGILVDGAVVLVENVLHAVRHEKPSDRKSLMRLVIKSAVDVGRPTLYAMLIIIAALLPVFTLESVEGRIFRPLALTYTFALLGALIFSLTIVPALCAILFKAKDQEVLEPVWIEKLRDIYRKALTFTLDNRRLVVLVFAVIFAIGAMFASRPGSEFLPELDEGDLMIYTELPASIATEKSQDILLDIHKRIRAFPETEEVLTEHGRPEDGTDNEGVNVLRTFVRLKPAEEWHSGRNKAQLIEAMRLSLEEIPGKRLNFSQPIKDSVEEAVAGVRGKVVLKIFGTDLEQMRASLRQAKAELQKIPGVTELGLYRDSASPQLRILLDRTLLARAGIPIEHAAQTIETALAGKVVTQYWEGERPVPIRLRLPKATRDDIEKISHLNIPTPTGANIPLQDLANIAVEDGAAYIVREGNTRLLALKFNVQGRDMGSVVNEAMAVIKEKITLPDGLYFVWGGEFENQQRAIERLKMVVPVAILLVLILLYTAMNSARSAFAILAISPMALLGGAIALLVTGISLSVSAVIGFIALLGQVALMGVLMLSATDALRREEYALFPAIITGSVDRLRPVLMASLLAFFGLLPMALSEGVGSEVQRPFAIVVVGGMITTLLTALFLLPTVYSLIAAKQLKTIDEEVEL
jgi:heavy metal efflux system protein